MPIGIQNFDVDRKPKPLTMQDIEATAPSMDEINKLVEKAGVRFVVPKTPKVKPQISGLSEADLLMHPRADESLATREFLDNITSDEGFTRMTQETDHVLKNTVVPTVKDLFETRLQDEVKYDSQEFRKGALGLNIKKVVPRKSVGNTEYRLKVLQSAGLDFDKQDVEILEAYLNPELSGPASMEVLRNTHGSDKVDSAVSKYNANTFRVMNGIRWLKDFDGNKRIPRNVNIERLRFMKTLAPVDDPAEEAWQWKKIDELSANRTMQIEGVLEREQGKMSNYVKWASATGSTAQSFFSLPGDMVGWIAGGLDTIGVDSAAGVMANWDAAYKDAITKVYPNDPMLQDSFYWNKLPSAVGSMAMFALTSVAAASGASGGAVDSLDKLRKAEKAVKLAKLTPMLIGAIQSGANLHTHIRQSNENTVNYLRQEAKFYAEFARTAQNPKAAAKCKQISESMSARADEWEEDTEAYKKYGFVLGTGLGLTEGLSLGTAVDRVFGKKGFVAAKWLLATVVEGSEEAMQEGVQQISENFLVDKLTDEEVDLFAGTLESMEAGAMAGVFMSLIFSAYGMKNKHNLGSRASAAIKKHLGFVPVERQTKQAPKATQLQIGKGKPALTLQEIKLKEVEDYVARMEHEQAAVAEAAADKRLGVTEEELRAHAQARISTIKAAAAGTKATKGPGGITLPETPSRLLTAEERNELQFLEENADNPQALAGAYGARVIDVETPPVVEPETPEAGETMRGEVVESWKAHEPFSPFQVAVTGQPVYGILYRGESAQTPVDVGLYGKGRYFTTSKETASSYSDTQPVASTVRLDNPFVAGTTTEEQRVGFKIIQDIERESLKVAQERGLNQEQATDLASTNIRKWVESQGHDGIVLSFGPGLQQEVVVFYPNKSGTVKAVSDYRRVPGTPLKSAPAFYYKSKQVVEQKIPTSVPADNLLGLLRGAGVKEEEIEWLGLADLAEANKGGTLSKDDVLKVIEINDIELTEDEKKKYVQKSVLGLTQVSDNVWRLKVDRGGPFEGQPFGRIERLDNGKFLVHTPSLQDSLSNDLADAEKELVSRFDSHANVAQTQYHGYTQPFTTSDDYTEMTFSVPTVRYESSHFDRGGVVAHTRMDTQVDEAGNKTLLVHEVQSDLHQEGRDQGYTSENGAVPDAPFKTTWPDLVLKRLIRYAAENGHKVVAWTTGRQQADRYDLGKQVSRVYYNPTNGTLVVTDLSGADIVSKLQVTPQQLTDYVGKEAADKVVNNPSRKEGIVHVLEGMDLRIGGEGMKAFYDTILVNKANKLLKRFGIKVGKTTVQGHEVHSFEITPELKQMVMEVGQPLFSQRGRQREISPDMSDAEFSNQVSDLDPTLTNWNPSKGQEWASNLEGVAAILAEQGSERLGKTQTTKLEFSSKTIADFSANRVSQDVLDQIASNETVNKVSDAIVEVVTDLREDLVDILVSLGMTEEQATSIYDVGFDGFYVGDASTGLYFGDAFSTRVNIASLVMYSETLVKFLPVGIDEGVAKNVSEALAQNILATIVHEYGHRIKGEDDVAHAKLVNAIWDKMDRGKYLKILSTAASNQEVNAVSTLLTSTSQEEFNKFFGEGQGLYSLSQRAFDLSQVAESKWRQANELKSAFGKRTPQPGTPVLGKRKAGPSQRALEPAGRKRRAGQETSTSVGEDERGSATVAQKRTIHDLAKSVGLIVGAQDTAYRKFLKDNMGVYSAIQLSEEGAKKAIALLKSMPRTEINHIDHIVKIQAALSKGLISKDFAENILPYAREIGIFANMASVDSVMRNIGVYDLYLEALELEMKRTGEMEDYFQRVKELKKMVGKEKATASKLFRILDGRGTKAERSGSALSPNEKKFLAWAKQHFDKWADELEIPENQRQKNYITHIFDAEAKRSILAGHMIDPTIYRMLRVNCPKDAVMQFLKERKYGGTIGLVEDVWAAMEAYEYSALRKKNFGPLIQKIHNIVPLLPQHSANYLSAYAQRLAGYPSKLNMQLQVSFDKIADVIQTIPGKQSKQLSLWLRDGHGMDFVAYGMTGFYYSVWLGFRPAAAIKNLAQQVLSFIEVGPEHFVKGKALLHTSRGKALCKQSTVLSTRKHGVLPAQDLEFIGKLNAGLQKSALFMFQLFDKYNVETAFLAGYSEAKSKGLSEAEAIQRGDEVASNTQFVYGKLGGPMWGQSAPGKFLTTLTTWPIGFATLTSKWMSGRKSEVYAKYERKTGKKIGARSTPLANKETLAFLLVIAAAAFIQRETRFKALEYTGWSSGASLLDMSEGNFASVEQTKDSFTNAAKLAWALTEEDPKKRGQLVTLYGSKLTMVTKNLYDIASHKRDWLSFLVYAENKRAHEKKKKRKTVVPYVFK